MALDYTIIGVSIFIFIIYLISFLFLIDLKKGVNKKAGTAFIFFMLALVFLTLRRLQQIFLKAEMVSFVPYFTDYVTLIFAVLFFFGVFFLHRAIKEAGKSSGKERISDVLKKYRGKF